MKFFAVALAAFAAGVSAYSAEGECTIVTVTETVTYGHTVKVPGTAVPSVAPYPTIPAHNSAPVASGTAPAHSEGTAAPTGTGVYTATPPEFTGAASGLKVAGVMAGAGAVAALFL